MDLTHAQPPSSPHSALSRATLLYFLHLRKAHPDFCVEDLLQALDLPRAALLVKLAEEAGFKLRHKAAEDAYGSSPYGTAPYGGSRKPSLRGEPVARKVTAGGQLSYRGHLYQVGTAYSGVVAAVREKERKVLVTLPGKEVVEFGVRH